MNIAVSRHDDKTIELTLSIPWESIQKTNNEVIEDFVRETELPGFRKGKAPRAVVEEKLDKTKIYEEVLQRLIPKLYAEAVAQEKIHPIVMPKINLVEAKEGTEWKILAITCERPDIKLGKYKEAIIDLKAAKQKKIWLPGQEPKKEDEDKEKKVTIDELLQTVYGAITTIIPKILLDQEVNRLLSDLVDQTKKLGLSVEQYLASTNRTADGVRHEYEEQAKRTLTLEFGLEAIADAEGILISDDDITAVIKTAKSEDERKAMENQKYYLATILRRQKTIDMLAAL